MSRDALIVGVSAYQYLPGLKAPAYDAEAIAQVLQTYGDFRVTRMPDVIQGAVSQIGQQTPVTLAELESALVRLFKPKGKQIPQTALFYYSGHGLQKDAGIQEGYLATSDANPRIGFYGLSLFWLRRLLQESPVKQRILLIDCCHSGEILNFLEADPGARPGTDRLFMAASREYEAAYESINGPYSVFTQALLEGLNPTRMPQGVVTNHALSDWVSTALKGEMQQPLFENSGSEIILTRCQPTVLQAAPQEREEICPYRGLEYFDEVHADYFFGREEITDQILDKLRTRNFLAVLGASGSGKTSLVRAGLLHKLRRGRAFSGSDRWRTHIITPTDQPLKSLATAFISSTANAVERAEQLRRAEMLLSASNNGLVDLTRASLQSGQHTRLLLVIDQFEEVFTLCQGPQAERDRIRFFNALLKALTEAQEILSVVIVLRADFFGKCSLYQGLAEQIERNLITITPLTYEQIKASVVKPAEKVGLMCEPNLIYNILLDVVGAPGELPLLQYTLLELWRRRQPDPQGGPTRLTLDAYTDLGGVRGTLQKRADEVFYSLSPEEQLVAKRVFIALTQLGEGTEDTRRRILKSELVSPRFPAELVERVLEKLVAAKLVVTNRISLVNPLQERAEQGYANISTALRLAQISRGKTPSQAEGKLFFRTQMVIDRDRDTTIASLTHRPTEHLTTVPLPLATRSRFQETVDVAHEALIRNWSLLRVWLDENRERLWQQRRIEQAAWEWDSSGQLQAAEYLLRGDRLRDAQNFLRAYPDDLSETAQKLITLSTEVEGRSQREKRIGQLVIPGTLVAALMMTFLQYQTLLKSQSEKNLQAQLAVSRQRAAIAQSILQEPSGDPTTALLISRLAIEQGAHSYEAEASLRAVLQKLRLQANLASHQGEIQALVFNPAGQQFATAGGDGSLKLWSQPQRTLAQVLATQNAAPYTQLSFSAQGDYLTAITPTQHSAEVWLSQNGTSHLRLEGFTQPIRQLSFSPKEDWLAAIGADNQLQVWQVGAKKRLIHQTLTARVSAIAFAPKEPTIAIAVGSTIQLWSLATGKLITTLPQPVGITQLVYSPNGQWLAIGRADQQVLLWHRPTGKMTQTLRIGLPSQQADRLHLRFSPDGQTLLTVDASQRLQLWQVTPTQLKLLLSTRLSTIATNSYAFSPDSRRLATLSADSDDGPIHLWDTVSGALEEKFGSTDGSLTTVQFSADGALLATGDSTGRIQLWTATQGGEMPSPKLDEKAAKWAIASSQGLISLTREGKIYQWQWANKKPSAESGTPSLSLNSVKKLKIQPFLAWLTRPQKDVLSSWPFNRLRFRPVNSRMPHSELPLMAAKGASPQLQIQATHFCQAPALLTATEVVTFSQDGTLVATAKPDGVWLWQVGANQALHRLNCMEPLQLASVKWQQLAISPDQRYLLGVLSDRVIVWELATGQQLATLTGHQAPINHAQFSPDSKQILTASQDRTVRLWEFEPVRMVKTFTYDQPMTRIRYQPEGSLIALAGVDGTARLITPDGELRVVLTGHQNPIVDINFSPNGQQVVTAGEDGIVRLWNATTGKEWMTFYQNGEIAPAPLKQAFFSKDGGYVFATTQTGQVTIWAAGREELMKLARDRTLRQLNPDECLRYLGLRPDACPTLTTFSQPQ